MAKVRKKVSKSKVKPTAKRPAAGASRRKPATTKKPAAKTGVAAPVLHEGGFYRVHLAEVDGDGWVTVYVPLDAEMRFRLGAPAPYLAKALWPDGEDLWGEFKHRAGRLNIFYWNGGEWSETDFLTVPVHVNGLVRFETDDPEERLQYVIRNVQRM